ncbi:MAG: ABC transporter permease [Planctomycetes bacterium]|nr:ABC transporter permease [Planctomycetota bacterium]MBU4399317.1 ABC transporter permease [Planctomycetota bacterium]
MFERVKHMLIKEFIQVFRDPRMRVVIFLIPCVQVMVIGYAVSTDVKHVRTALYDLDNSRPSRDLAARFVRSGYFDVTERIGDDARARELLDRGEVSAVLHFQHGFAEDIRAGRTARLQVLIDGTDSNTAGIVAGYAVKIATAYSKHVLIERVERAFGPAGKTGTIDLQTRAWFNENLESRNFFVPGVLMIVVALSTLLLTSMAVVREKEIGTIEQIMVTPITPAEFILGKTVPFALIGLVQAIIVALLGVFWFEVPIRGSVFLLLPATVLFLMNTLGTGLLISTFSQTQQQAMMTTFLLFFPAMLLSGFAFPIANMPQVVQWMTLVNPLRYFLAIVRSIFLKGVGLEILWGQMLPLFAMGIAMLWLAVRRFHKTL